MLCRYDGEGEAAACGEGEDGSSVACSTQLIGNGGDGAYEEAVVSLMAAVYNNGAEFASSMVAGMQAMAAGMELQGARGVEGWRAMGVEG